MPFGLQTVDWQQKPNARERIMLLATLGVFLLGFLKACWFPSRSAIDDLREEIEKVNQERKVAAQLLPVAPVSGAAPVTVAKSAALLGAGSVKDVQMAIEKIAQPLLLKGVHLLGMKAADLEREGNMVREKVELQLAGNFYSVAEYLEATETLPAPLIIEDFAIILNDDKSGRVTATIKGSFYGMDK